MPVKDHGLKINKRRNNISLLPNLNHGPPGLKIALARFAKMSWLL
jgi:hypothetical protein